MRFLLCAIRSPWAFLGMAIDTAIQMRQQNRAIAEADRDANTKSPRK